MSAIEDQFAFQLDALKIKYEREAKPVPGRRWRVDFLIGKWLAVEVEGGHWINGRHTRGKGFEGDCEKYNTLSNMGIRVLRVTSTHVKNGMALKWVDEALA
jgi:very-short-patch-repair endonuclease